MDEAERMFRSSTNWVDADVAASLADLTGCVGDDDEVNVDKVYGIAHDLVIAKPYLKGPPRGDDNDRVPSGPTGVKVGSGRKFYGRPVINESTLRRKYPALNA